MTFSILGGVVLLLLAAVTAIGDSFARPGEDLAPREADLPGAGHAVQHVAAELVVTEITRLAEQ